MVKARLQPKKHVIEWYGAEPRRLLDLLGAAGVELDSSCGGRGKCGKCRVQVLAGDCTPPGEDERALLPAEELASGVRLACCCKVRGKVTLLSRYAGEQMRILENSLCPDFQLKPVIRKQVISISRDCEQGSLFEYLVERLGVPVIGQSLLHVLRFLGEHGQERLTAVLYGDALLGIESGDTTANCYGVAVDIGTTTVVAGLLDLAGGREMAVASTLNPQKKYGLDVLSRIHHAQNDPSGSETLSNLMVQCLNNLIGELYERAGTERRHIYEMVVAANTVMLHLLLGVNPRQLGRAPYHTVFRQGQVIDAGRLGLATSPFARIYCLPSVSSFIGADIVAGIMATELDRTKATVLFLDIGTNGEIVLHKDGKLLACSAAAGPALEGMNISCGMRAADGAVEGVRLQNGTMSWRTIGDFPPRGLCGSGLLDLVAVMLDAEVVSPAGRIVAKDDFLKAHPRSPLAVHIDETAGKRRFWLVPPSSSGESGVYISQADIRQVQLAKSAIAAGIKALLARAGVMDKEVERVYLAGALGSYVNPQSLIRLGFFPRAWQDRIVFAGNSARAGAVMAMLSEPVRLRAEEIAQKVDYFELSSCPDFEKLFAQNIAFPRNL